MAYKSKKIQTITQCSLFGAVVCLLSPWCLMVGPVPITLSLFAVVLAGSVLPVRKALTSIAIYVLMGCIGLPVFAGFQGGAGVLLGPGGGFIWSYPVVVLLISSVNGKGAVSIIIAAIVSLLICYGAGTAQYMAVTGTKSVSAAALVCVVPFVPFDIIKTFGAVFVGSEVRRKLKKQNLL